MRSSISSSNDRLPVLSWRRAWVGAVLLSLVALGGWETFWRLEGYHRIPSSQDSLEWALARKNASRDGEKAVVLIGSSRAINDFDADAFASMTGIRPVQLSIVGKSPIAVLGSLADDHNFSGTVICDFHEVFVYASEGTRNGRMNLGAEDFVKAYTDRSFLNDLIPGAVERYVHRLLTQTFVFQLPELSPTNVIHHLIRRELPPKPQDTGAVVQDGMTIHLAGHKMSDGEIQGLRKHFEELTMNCITNTAITRTLPLDVARILERMVKRIQSRGGRVVFVCFPMSGRLWDLNEQYYPRKEFWDVIAAHTSATSIHFKDYPSLSGFDCPDWSHLDAEDATRFTRALTAILFRQGQPVDTAPYMSTEMGTDERIPVRRDDERGAENPN